MDSKMTRAFKAKAQRRTLGACRPGFAQGTTDVYKSAEGNSFGDMGTVGGGASQMTQQPGGAGMVAAAGQPASMQLGGAATPAPGTGQSLGQSSLAGATGERSTISQGPLKTDGSLPVGAYSDTGQGRVAADKQRYIESGMSEATYNNHYSPDAVTQRDAAAKVQDRLANTTLAEKAMLSGQDPNARFSFSRGSGAKVFRNDGADVRNTMRARGIASLGFGGAGLAPNAPPEMQAAIRQQATTRLGAQAGFADGGAVQPQQNQPAKSVYDVPDTFMGHVRRIGGLVGQMVDEARGNAPPARREQVNPLDTRGLIVQRNAANAEAREYANGGEVEQFEFQGRGGPREDKIPVRFAGEDIRVSDGERGMILPARTAQNPHAVDAIEDIIQSTNGGREPRRGLAQGGHYADGLDPRTAAGALDAGRWSPEATQFRAERGLTGEPVGAAQVQAAPIRPVPITETPAPAAEANVRRGLSDKVFDALKGGAQKVAGKALGMEPKASTVAQSAAQPAMQPVEKAPMPITDRARAYGQAIAKGEIPGMVKVDAQGNKYLTKGAGLGMGAGTALQTGDHWDAYDDRHGGLTHGERAQLFARDLGVLAGGTLGAVGGGITGSFVTPVAGTVAGGLIGSGGGGYLANKGMNAAREGINWANEKLGGAPDYFEDSDAMIARDRASREAAGIKEGSVQKSVRGINTAIGSVLQKASNSISGEPQAVPPATAIAPPAMQGDQAQVRRADNAGTDQAPVTVAPAPATDARSLGYGAMTVTGEAMNNGLMMPGVKRHALGTTVALNDMGPNQYVGADGSANQAWEKTSAYADAQRRAQQNRIDLQQVQDERRGTSSMASRALGQTMQAPGANSQSGGTTSDEVMAQALHNMASVDPGTRALGQHQLAAQNQMITQQMAKAKLGYEQRNTQIEQARFEDAAVGAKQEKLQKKLETQLITKGGKDGNEDVPDADAISQFHRMAGATVKANLEEAKSGTQKAKWINPRTGKSRDPAELDEADHAKMLQQFKVRQRALATMGVWPGDTDRGDSIRLDHWTPHISKDGTTVYFPHILKDGKPLSGNIKQFRYTEPVKTIGLQATKTPTNDILADAIQDK